MQSEAQWFVVVVTTKSTMHPMPTGIVYPVSSGIAYPMSPGIMHPASSRMTYSVPTRIMHPAPLGIRHPFPSGIRHPISSRVRHPISPGIRHPLQLGGTPPVSSVPLALLFSNGSVNASTTPVAAEIMRNVNHQMSDSHHRRGTHKDLLHTQSGILEQKNRNSKHRQKSEPHASLPAVDTSVTKNSTHVTSDVAMGIRIPTSVTASPCFSASAPAARLARHLRRQQQADIVNFAGAKFSESPQAKVVPLPPFMWCEEVSSLSCSGDEQSLSPTTEVIKLGTERHGEHHETSKWTKCSPGLQVMPSHCVAVLPSS
ncbi:unnamed protein product [Litomosoides sigmodontis]|uniref:Uncharacterized protein n=1 Tax=Litomosoides sigmodontis TaxID=42156 RepID=A0A3P6TX72_LITSI|nr:unnamed protein product [Litomosoides sigmodontis]